MHTGSAFILITSFFGRAPSTFTTPFTSPAVAVSTFWPDGAADGDEGSADLLDVSWPPPQASVFTASAIPSRLTQAFRKRIRSLLNKKDTVQTTAYSTLLL